MKTADIEVSYVNHMGDDLSVVNAARVSFHKESEWGLSEVYDDGFTEYAVKVVLSEKDAKLINYLAKHKHFSPFNHTFITLRVRAPIFVARQLVKHKFMPWNEVSRRYVDEEPEFYMPDYWRGKADNVKQGSSDEKITRMCHHDSITGEPWEVDINNSFFLYNESCLNMYSDLLTAQVAPEQARMVLPQNMMTEWWWSGTLGAYTDMLRLRLDPHTQYESRIVAQKARAIIEPLFPVSVPALLGENQ